MIGTNVHNSSSTTTFALAPGYFEKFNSVQHYLVDGSHWTSAWPAQGLHHEPLLGKAPIHLHIEVVGPGGVGVEDSRRLPVLLRRLLALLWLACFIIVNRDWGRTSRTQDSVQSLCEWIHSCKRID